MGTSPTKRAKDPCAPSDKTCRFATWMCLRTPVIVTEGGQAALGSSEETGTCMRMQGETDL